MRRLGISIALAMLAGIALVAQAHATDLSTILKNKEGPDNFQIIHVSDLAKMMSDSTTKVWIFDANHDELREQAGIIPGAHLLSSSDNYNVAVLPKDKSARLVFYCANTH